MTVQSGICSIPLPKGWKTKVPLAMVQVVALAHRAMVQARGRAASGRSVQRRLLIENERLRHELALTQEELRIKDARMQRVAPAKRPHYTPVERLAILEIRAARGWSLADVAQRFLVTETTIASWQKRLDGSEGDRLLALPSPVNKFPDFVRYTVQRRSAALSRNQKQWIEEPSCGRIVVQQTRLYANGVSSGSPGLAAPCGFRNGHGIKIAAYPGMVPHKRPSAVRVTYHWGQLTEAETGRRSILRVGVRSAN